MFTEYYKKELDLLNNVAKEFAQDNPSLRGLIHGASSDPDAVRILEGVAFLTANIKKQQDEQFPKFLHSLLQLIAPHYLRPIPSVCIMEFQPKPSLTRSMTIKKGVYLDSKPLEDDVTCRFQTCFDTEILPLEIKNALIVESDNPVDNDKFKINISFQVNNVTLDQTGIKVLRLHLSKDFVEGTNLYFLLINYLKNITITNNGHFLTELPSKMLSAVGFASDEDLLPSSGAMLPAFNTLQEYFLFPEKFLFVDIDLSHWVIPVGISEFELTFVCSKPNFPINHISKDNFALHAVPAVNLFETESQPVLLNQRSRDIKILPENAANVEQEIYSVNRVESMARGMSEPREYARFGGFQKSVDQAVYEIEYKSSMSGEGGADTYVSLSFPLQSPIADREVLSMSLTCSNGSLAESLLPGDICVPTSSTSELVTFRNLTAPTYSRHIPLEGDMLWYLVSHLSMNYLSIHDAETLRSILNFYIAPDNKDKGNNLVNKKRVNAIENYNITPDEALYGNSFIRGQRIRIKIRSEKFTCAGDKFLFGSMLNLFFASTSALNIFSILEFEDFFSGELIQWPIQLGTRPLI